MEAFHTYPSSPNITEQCIRELFCCFLFLHKYWLIIYEIILQAFFSIFNGKQSLFKAMKEWNNYRQFLLSRSVQKKVLRKKITFKFLRHCHGSCEAYFSTCHSSMTSMVWNSQIDEFGGPLSYTSLLLPLLSLVILLHHLIAPYSHAMHSLLSATTCVFTLCYLSDGRWTRRMKMHWYCTYIMSLD